MNNRELQISLNHAIDTCTKLGNQWGKVQIMLDEAVKTVAQTDTKRTKTIQCACDKLGDQWAVLQGELTELQIKWKRNSELVNDTILNLIDHVRL